MPNTRSVTPTGLLLPRALEEGAAVLRQRAIDHVPPRASIVRAAAIRLVPPLGTARQHLVLMLLVSSFLLDHRRLLPPVSWFVGLERLGRAPLRKRGCRVVGRRRRTEDAQDVVERAGPVEDAGESGFG
jgi:hypothetical protein